MLPEEGHEDRLAFRLASTPEGLEARILHMLAGRPRRFRDFKGLLPEGKSDTPITRSLKSLMLDGLVDKGLDTGRGDDHSYALTGFGIKVLFRSHEFQPTATILNELRKSGVLAS